MVRRYPEGQVRELFGPYLAGVLDVEFARWFDEPRDAQDARHEVPRHLLAPPGEFMLEEIIEPEHAPEGQCQVHVSEVACALDADALRLYLHSFRHRVIIVIARWLKEWRLPRGVQTDSTRCQYTWPLPHFRREQRLRNTAPVQSPPGGRDTNAAGNRNAIG